MATKPLVTIAMSVRDGGEQLLMSVRSIMDQTFTDWVLILVDDGSTDGAVQKISALGDGRIHIVQDGENHGLARRLNQIVEVAQTRYLARMDHDDIAHPERLARQIAFLEENPDTSLLATRCLSMSEAGEIIGQLPFAQSHDEICARPWLGFSLAHPSWLGRAEWFKSHRYADPAPYCCEDQELLLRAYKTSRYHALPEPLLAYRVRSRTPFLKLFRTRVALALVQARFFASQRRFGDCFLATGALGVRVFADLLRAFAPRVRSDVRALGGPALPEWTAILDDLREPRRAR